MSCKFVMDPAGAYQLLIRANTSSKERTCISVDVDANTLQDTFPLRGRSRLVSQLQDARFGPWESPSTVSTLVTRRTALEVYHGRQHSQSRA